MSSKAVCLGQVIQQQQHWLDDQIIWMTAWGWYCHWWVEGCFFNHFWS